jgi:hypothetical protein
MVKESGKYTIECGFIYLNSLLRGSILYGAEAMINMKEDDYRKIEQIEEDQMRLLFETDRSCSIHLMYLESGQVPARFQIKRMGLNFYHYILNQKEDSLLYQMLDAQRKSPIKNYFHETIKNTIKEFDMNEITEVKNMSKNVFKKLVKEKCRKAIPKYLLEKQSRGSKGDGIKYEILQMADYLMPQSNMSIKDQRELFSRRCRTNKLGANREIIEFCETKCGESLDNAHSFKCEMLNTDRQTKFDFEKVLNGYIIEKKDHLKVWRENHEGEKVLRTPLNYC